MLLALTAVFSQDPAAGAKPSVVTGDVSAVAEHGITIKTKNGDVAVGFTETTAFKRVSAEKPDIKAAAAADQKDIAVGDKVIVSGVLSPDGHTVPARSVYLLTKADLAQKSAHDLEQWRTRGISGKVTAVDAASNNITVQIAGLTGNTSLTLAPKQGAKFLKYAPDSIRFDEAKPSSLTEVQQGDMIRALGDRSTDGTRFDAEEIVTGAFQTIAGTVRSVDTEKNEILIKDLRTGKDVTVVVTDSSTLKRFPAEMAERMAGRAAGGVRPAGEGGTRPAGGPPSQGAQGQGQGRGFGGGRAGGIDDMLDRFPQLTVAELKPGDMIALSSSRGAVAGDRVKAIKLLAGVEPFLRMAQASGGGQRGQQGIPGGLSIPGLDGISFP